MNAALRSKAAFLVLLALIAVSMYALNAHTPLMMDDYDYSVSWATGLPLAGVADVIASQAAHYRIWGGRSVTHTLAQLFLYWGKGAFNFANTAAYIGLLLQICFLAGAKGGRLNGLTLLAAHCALMCLVPFFGVSFLWLDGACNYLFGTLLALTPLMIALSERVGGFFDAGWSRGWPALPVCLIAGWTNENTACGVLAVMLLLLLWDRFRGRRIRRWRVAAAAFETAGVLLLLLAPGNFARASQEASRPIIMELAYRFAVTTYCALRYAGVLLALCALLLVIARRRGAALPAQRLMILGGAAFLSAYALVGSPQISDRSFTAVIVLVLSAALALLCALPQGRRRAAATAALLLTASAVTVQACGAVKAHGAAWRTQLEKAQAALERGETRVVLDSVPSESRFTMAIALEEDAAAWPNSTLSKALGVAVYGR
ncbi:MAG: hypothetical protein IJD60_08685 [Clostridia bacterium]|nr:hypothetical protein [Clostridia bacterium]